MTAAAVRRRMVRAGVKMPALFLQSLLSIFGSIVLQSFVVHLDRVEFWPGKESKRSYLPLVISSGLPCGQELLK